MLSRKMKLVVRVAVVFGTALLVWSGWGSELSAAPALRESPHATVAAEEEGAAHALMKQRIALLERALGAKTPKRAVKTWAEARYTRNGALEFAVLDPATRDKQLKSFEELNWVTGVSSPWIARYRVGRGEKQEDGGVRFPVKFDYRTSADVDDPMDWSKIEPVYVTVRKGEEFWYVTDVTEG